MSPEKPTSFDVLGLPISITTLAESSDFIHRWGQDNTARLVFIRDVHGVVQAQDMPELHDLHQQADMITPDGMPLVLVAKMRGLPVSRTSGPDLMPYVLQQSATSGLKHYFYGGKPGIAEQLKAAFEARFPGVNIVGTATPPFRDMTDAELAEHAATINASGAQVVWVGISTPKQEFLMQRMKPLLGATLIGVGAAFDFHTGAVKRAPLWMQRSGLEWLHRLCSEPKRLWRRYLVMAPRFVVMMIADRIGMPMHRKPHV
jgi:N-acetylglucosaminyldiphosphoundecaprenol N-acetyl-beta-D-mannosaminyltransferase